METSPTSSPDSDPVDVNDGSDYPFQASRWPVIFGVIAIIFGVLGALSAGWTVLGAVFMVNMEVFTDGEELGDPEADAMFEAMTESWERWADLTIVMFSGWTLLALLLLVSGILLIRRKPIARPLLISWSYARIVVGIGGAAVQTQMQREQMSAIMDSAGKTIASKAGPSSAPSPPPPDLSFMNDIMSGVMGAFFIIWVLWIVALPVLLLIWLNRDLVKADIETWR